MSSSLDLRATGKTVLLSACVGIVAGLGAIVFQFACQLCLHFVLAGFTGWSPVEPRGEASWFHAAGGTPSLTLIVLVMAAGGLVSGILVYTFAPDAEGHGTDAAIEAFHHKRGAIAPLTALVKLVASAVTIGTGGSGGREGPIAQIGAGFGSFVGARLKLSARERRVLMAAGMGAGVAAIFRAPLAGALFAAEILYREAEFESEVIVPAAIASIISYSVYALSLPAHLMFTPLFGEGLGFALGSPFELLPLTILAVVLSLTAVVYIKVFYGTHALFKKLPLPRHVRPAVGAGLAGLFGIGLYTLIGNEVALSVLSSGYGAIQGALDTSVDIGIGVLCAIAFGKILTTSLTIGSGGSGGVFGPSMVIGGTLGAAAGQTLHGLWPALVTQPQAYTIVGMAGFFSGCAHAPISTLVMVSEITGDYRLLIPAMWVSTLCFILCRPWTIYEKQVPTRLESPAHRGDFIIDLLEGFRVREVFRPGRPFKLIGESTPLETILKEIAASGQSYFPVVRSAPTRPSDGGESDAEAEGEHDTVSSSAADEHMVGIFSANDVRAFIYDESMWRVAIARDIMVTDFLSVTLDDDLNTALRRFTARNIDELPVIDTPSGRVLGLLRRKDVIAFYNERLEEQKRNVDS